MKKTTPLSIGGLALLLLVSAGSFTSARAQEKLNIFGYLSTEIERGWNEPVLLPNGTTGKENGPAAFSIHSFNLIMTSNLSDQFKVYANLSAGESDPVSLVNAWGEYTQSQYLVIRAGKTYRKFGLYNEILDASPTYFGIDPPEHFSHQHVIVSRTTSFMVYGRYDIGRGNFNYSLSTDNGEGLGDTFEKSLPLGWDLNYKWDNGNYTVGTSGYSTFGHVHSDVGFGEGPSRNGVQPWMAEDKFSVFSGYAEGKFGNLTLQAEYVYSPHNATRDIARTMDILGGAILTQGQHNRFLIDPNGPVAEGNINTAADYNVSAYYVRAAYTFETSIGDITPFAWMDQFKNPELIWDEQFGGDGEAGVTDSGVMGSYTFGVTYRPDPSVALKMECENNFKSKSGQLSSTALRLNASYIFGQ